VNRLYFLHDGREMVRRRARVPKGSVVEAESKALLDAAGEQPMTATLAIPAEAVPIFYGPHLRDLESLPREESLRARVLSAHAIAVAWITLDGSGRRPTHEAPAPDAPVFHLRRPGGGAGHVWRFFRTKREAIEWMRATYGAEAEGVEWARVLPADDFDGLLRRHAGA
jgi:hypothetical protein